jgi:hypothetical protein
LRIWTTDDQTTWVHFLSLAEFVHNSWPHDRTTLTPHELLFGVKPPFPLSDEEAQVPDVTTRLRQIRLARDKAETALRVSKERLIPIQFEEGEQVWLEGRNLKTHHPTAKLAPRRYGPFLVSKKLSPMTYRLTLPTSMNVTTSCADYSSLFLSPLSSSPLPSLILSSASAALVPYLPTWILLASF